MCETHTSLLFCLQMGVGRVSERAERMRHKSLLLRFLDQGVGKKNHESGSRIRCTENMEKVLVGTVYLKVQRFFCIKVSEKHSQRRKFPLFDALVYAVVLRVRCCYFQGKAVLILIDLYCYVFQSLFSQARFSSFFC